MLNLKDKIELIKINEKDKNGAYQKYIEKGMNGSYSTFDRSLRKWKKRPEVIEAIEKGNLLGDFIETNANPYSNYEAQKVTTQMNGEGNITQVWVKSDKKDELKQEYDNFLKRVNNITPKEYKPIKIDVSNEYLEISLYDMHFGMNSFEYYQTLLNRVIKIINQDKWKKIYFVIGQDLFHCDNFRGTTTKGTQLDLYLKEQDWEDALDFYVALINAAIKQSKKIEVIYSKGNHDESVSYGFVRELKAYYRLYNQIIFDLEIEEYKARKIGNVMIVFTHSDKIKMNPETVLKMINLFKDIYVQCEYVEIHAGHLHHQITKEYAGSVLRNQSSGAKTDRWHKDNGFIGAQKMFQLYQYSEIGLDAIFNVRV